MQKTYSKRYVESLRRKLEKSEDRSSARATDLNIYREQIKTKDALNARLKRDVQILQKSLAEELDTSKEAVEKEKVDFLKTAEEAMEGYVSRDQEFRKYTFEKVLSKLTQFRQERDDKEASLCAAEISLIRANDTIKLMNAGAGLLLRGAGTLTD